MSDLIQLLSENSLPQYIFRPLCSWNIIFQGSRKFHLFAYERQRKKRSTLRLVVDGTARSMKNEKSLTYVYAPLSSSFMTYLLNHTQTSERSIPKERQREGERVRAGANVYYFAAILHRMHIDRRQMVKIIFAHLRSQSISRVMGAPMSASWMLVLMLAVFRVSAIFALIHFV